MHGGFVLRLRHGGVQVSARVIVSALLVALLSACGGGVIETTCDAGHGGNGGAGGTMAVPASVEQTECTTTGMVQFLLPDPSKATFARLTVDIRGECNNGQITTVPAINVIENEAGVVSVFCTPGDACGTDGGQAFVIFSLAAP